MSRRCWRSSPAPPCRSGRETIEAFSRAARHFLSGRLLLRLVALGIRSLVPAPRLPVSRDRFLGALRSGDRGIPVRAPPRALPRDHGVRALLVDVPRVDGPLLRLAGDRPPLPPAQRTVAPLRRRVPAGGRVVLRRPSPFLWGAQVAFRIAWTSLIAVSLFLDLSVRCRRVRE